MKIVSLPKFCFAFALVCFLAAPAGLTAQDETPKETQSKKSDSVQEEADSKANDSKAKNEDSESKKEEADSKPRRNRRSRSRSNSKRSQEFVDLFSDVAASASASTVRVMSGSREIALGAVVDSDGLIVTKASELRGSLKCLLPDGSKLEASVFGLDKDTDLALLKVDAKNLAAINWGQDVELERGQWLVSPDGEGGSLGVGVVGVRERKIPPGGGFLGIMPGSPTEGTGVRVTQVTSNQPADRAGVLVNDVIIKIDDIDITNILVLRETLRNYSEGDQISLTVRRGKEELVLKLRLNDFRKANAEQFQRSSAQNRMGSTLSRRRLDFPTAFQHDSPLQARNCGGPIVNLDGQVVGLNIARAGRVKTYALPATLVVNVIESLKSGEFAPQVVNKDRIKEVEAELKSLGETEQTFPEEKTELEDAVSADDVRIKEIERMMADMEKRLKELGESKMEKSAKLKSMQEKFDRINVERTKLNRELEALKTGIRK